MSLQVTPLVMLSGPEAEELIGLLRTITARLDSASPGARAVTRICLAAA